MKQSKQKKRDIVKSSPSVEKTSQASEEKVQELSREDEEAEKESVTEGMSEMKRIESTESAKLVSDPGMLTVGEKRENCITSCFPP